MPCAGRAAPTTEVNVPLRPSALLQQKSEWVLHGTVLSLSVCAWRSFAGRFVLGGFLFPALSMGCVNGERFLKVFDDSVQYCSLGTRNSHQTSVESEVCLHLCSLSCRTCTSVRQRQPQCWAFADPWV